MPAAAGSWRPRGRSSCATCTSGARPPATGPGPTRWSRVRWTGPTASSRRRSARSRCGAGSGSIRGPSPRRCVRCIHRSVLGSRPKLLLRIRAGRVHPVTAPSIADGAVLRALHELGGRGIVYQEVFGPDPARCAASMAELDAAVRPLRRLATAQLVLGVSPHAPYTVSAPLYEAVARFARSEQLPIALHVAESKEETVLVRDGEGPFAEALRARRIAVEARRVSPIAYLAQRGVITPGTLCIHCVQADAADVELLRVAGAAVAHCPRSNAAHRHGRLPAGLLRHAGVPVGPGTDSVVSVGELDLWGEADAAGLRGDAALRALTIEGARALGWESEIGSLEVGNAADLAVFPFAAESSRRPSPPLAALTVVRGQIVHQISAP